MKKICFLVCNILAIGFATCSAGVLDGVQTDDRQSCWQDPVVQKINVPSQITNGLFIPQHDEFAIIQPGKWEQQENFSADIKQIIESQEPVPSQTSIRPVSTKSNTVIEKIKKQPEPVFLNENISMNIGSAPLRIVLSEIATQINVPIITEEGVD